MGVIYSYFFPPKEDYQFDIPEFQMGYSIYHDVENPLTEDNLILHNIKENAESPLIDSRGNS